MTAARLVVTAATRRLGAHRRPDRDRLRRLASSAATPRRPSNANCRRTRRPTAGPASACCSSPSAATRCKRPLVNRVGQCILTCPTTACYNGLPVAEGSRHPHRRQPALLRRHACSSRKMLDGRRYWRLPVMDGEFVCEDFFGTVKGVAGGNFLMLGPLAGRGAGRGRGGGRGDRHGAGVIAPFPGGVVRSGSKVGSRYKKLKASTNDAYCPTLRGAGQERPARRSVAPSTRSSSTASIWRRSRRRCARASGPRAGPASCASRRATTAASSARSTCTCTSCWPSEPPC